MEDSRHLEIGPVPCLFFQHDHAIRDFAQQLGLKPIALERPRLLYARHHLRPLGLFSLSFQESLELLSGTFRKAPPTEEDTLLTWGSRQFGDRSGAGIISAVTRAIWGAVPSEIGVAQAFPALWDALTRYGMPSRALAALGIPKREAWMVPGGWAEAAHAVTERVGLPAPARVVRLSLDHNRWRVHTNGGSERVRAVIIATEAQGAARLLETIPQLANPDRDPGSYIRLGEAVEALSSIRYAPLTLAHWRSPNAAFPHGIGYMTGTSGPLLRCQFCADVQSSPSPGGRTFVTLLGGTSFGAAANADEAEARRWVLEEHQRLTGRPCAIDAFSMVRFPRGISLPSPGFLARKRTILAGLPPGIALAGGYLGNGTAEAALASGQRAAEAIHPSVRDP